MVGFIVLPIAEGVFVRNRLLVAALADAVAAKVVHGLVYLLVADRAGLPVVGFIVLPIVEGVLVDRRFGLADGQLGIDQLAVNNLFAADREIFLLCRFGIRIDVIVAVSLRDELDRIDLAIGVGNFCFGCPDGQIGTDQTFIRLVAGDRDRAVSSFQNDACILAPHGTVRSDSDTAGSGIKPVLSVCAVLLTGDRAIDYNVAGDADEGVAGHSAVNSQVLCPCGVVVVIAYRKTAVDRFQRHIQRGVCIVCRNAQIASNVLGCGQLVGRFIIGHTVGQSRLGILCGDRCAVDAETIRGSRCRNKSVRADTQILCAHRTRIVDLTFHFGRQSAGCAVARYNVIIAGGIGAGKCKIADTAAIVLHGQCLRGNTDLAVCYRAGCIGFDRDVFYAGVSFVTHRQGIFERRIAYRPIFIDNAYIAFTILDSDAVRHSGCIFAVQLHAILCAIDSNTASVCECTFALVTKSHFAGTSNIALPTTNCPVVFSEITVTSCADFTLNEKSTA